MDQKLLILCPHHGQREEITLPDGYSNFYKGDIPCGHDRPASMQAIYIELDMGSIVTVRKLAGGPDP